MIENVKANDTLRFILPMFYNAEQKLDANFFVNNYFIGAYTSDLLKPEYDDKLILVYSYYPTEEFLAFEQKLVLLLNPIVLMDQDGYTVKYVIDIPKGFEEDYDLIVSQEFSQISPSLKLKIIKMWGLLSDDMLFKVLTEQEEYEGEPFENEIFNLNLEENVTEIL